MADTARPRLRWYRDFLLWQSLFLVLLLILCGWFGVKMEQADKQKTAVEEIENMGGTVWRDYQFDVSGNEISGAEPPGDPWLRRLLGDDFFMNVVKLDLTRTEITDAGLEHLDWLPHLRSLSLGERITDAGLVHLQGLPQFHTLNLRATKVADAGLAHLQGLPRLQSLYLGERITDAGLVHLQALPQLHTLNLRATKVTGAGIKGLQEALPNCTIYWTPPTPPAR
ncbi:MAG: hypothetical protein ABR915_18810 [Thermoguttaceae bacterium]